MFRVNGKEAIGLAIAMRDGGDILTLGRNLDAAMREITANLPIGVEPTLVADQPVVVDHAIHEFLESLWQAIAIIMVVSFISSRRPPGHRGRAVDPADHRPHVPDHGAGPHRSAAHLAGRAHHRAHASSSTTP